LTGYAYQDQNERKAQKQKVVEEEEEEEDEMDEYDKLLLSRGGGDEEGEDGNDSDFDDMLEEGDDPIFRKLREDRMAQMKREHHKNLEHLAKGHGEYREIVQDEFLPEVTGSERVICHFFHNEFERSKIMDHHLAILSPLHMETKFIKINAEKAPFFVDKLQVCFVLV